MKYGKHFALLPLAITLATTTLGFSQDIVWTQPYSGGVVYGPFASEGGDLPNCPKCQCDACQPDGGKGFVKRFWGGVCDRIHRGRREYYFNKQIYHTGYTRPVLPPYCEPGFGYYETAWRQSAAPVYCDPHQQGVSFDSEMPVESPIPVAPSPVIDDTPPKTKPSPAEVPNSGESTDETQTSVFNSFNGQVGYEKPRYEVTSPETQAGYWKPVSITPGPSSKLRLSSYPQ